MTYLNKYQSTSTLKRLLVLCSVWVFFPYAAHGQQPSDFEQLPEELQETLSPFASYWDRLEPSRQLMLVNKARRADSEERKRFKAQAERWSNMTPEERKKVRKAQRRFDQLPPHKRKELRHNWKNMNREERRKITEKMHQQPKLSATKQKEIRDKVKQMSAEERRQFLDEIRRQRQGSTGQKE